MLIALAALLFQSQDPEPIEIPPLTSSGFQTTARLVQEAVDEGDWDEAKRLADRLPSYEVTVNWSETGLTDQQRVFFARARDEAIAAIKQWVPELTVTYSPDADIAVSFVPNLPPNADSTGPAGAVYTYSPAKDDPIIEAVWALVRSEEKRPIDVNEIKNETFHAVGLYLGMSRLPVFGAAMYRSENPYLSVNAWNPMEQRLVQRIVKLSDRIRTAVAKKENPAIAFAEIFVTPNELKPRPVEQNGRMAMSLQVTNRGKGVLEYVVVPDCGCFGIDTYNKRLMPDETTIVPIVINTLDFVGKLEKNLYVYSNDPELPTKRIPFDAIVRPAYRFVNVKDEVAVIIEEDKGALFETILVVDDNVDFRIRRISVSGVMAAVDQPEPWTGTLDHPEIGEGPRKRKGYLIRASLGLSLPAGRTPMQFVIETDHPVFKTLYHQVYVQRGIVTVPLSIYFGGVGKEPVRGSVLLTRPGRPYKIKKVVSDSEFIQASVEPFRGETEYKIVATYTGKAPIGRFFATIEVHTDDPKQPIVTVPIEGTVK